MENNQKPLKISVNDFETAQSLQSALRQREKPISKTLKTCEPYEKKSLSWSNIQQFEVSVPEWRLPLDESEGFPQNLDYEIGRLLALKSYNIIGTEREPIFERITAFASRTFNVPIALVSLVDLGRQWFMSNRGLGDTRETPRSDAFCHHAVYSNQDVFVVPDATKDPRFSSNPLVTGYPNIRFYAGSPLITPDGYKIGTVCIIDDKPRPDGLNLTDKQNLMELSGMAIDAMNNRVVDRKIIYEERSKMIACTAHDLLTPLSGIQMNLSLFKEEKEIWKMMDDHQKELILSSMTCSDILQSICQNEMESFRGKAVSTAKSDSGEIRNKSEIQRERQEAEVKIKFLVKNLSTIVDNTPKHVPLSMYVHENVPDVVISDGVKIFRSCLNYLTNACKHTKKGSILLRIFVTNKEGNKAKDKGDLYRIGDKVMFECIDTGPGIDVKQYQNLFRFWKDEKSMDADEEVNVDMTNFGLGLQSVANNISSLDGEYGYRPSNADHKLYQKLRPNDSTEKFLKVDEIGSNEYLSAHGSNGNSNRAESKTDSLGNTNDRHTGSIFWFSIPLVRPNSRDHSIHAVYSDNNAKKRKVTRDETDMKKERETETSIEQSTTDTKLSSKSSSTKNLDEGKMKNESIKKDSLKPPPPNRPILKDVQIKKTHALVIDDSVTIRKSIDRALTKYGFTVTHARNGMEGLKELKNMPYAVTFCDFLMPIMDGLDCVKQYREWETLHRPNFKQFIIGISAHASDGDAERGIKVGMNKFVAKPVKLVYLKEIVQGNEVKSAMEQLEKMSMNKDDLQSYVTDDSTSTSSKVENSCGPVCLIAHNSPQTLKALSLRVEAKGYRVSAVNNGGDTLRLLKMRNWDVVFIDEEMPQMDGTSCAVCFRQWEANNRVARQNNLFLLSRSFVADASEGHHMYPPGFDGALGEPISLKKLHEILDKGSDTKIVDREIVTR